MPEKWNRSIREHTVWFGQQSSSRARPMRSLGVNQGNLLTFEGGVCDFEKNRSCKHTCAKKILHATTAEEKNHASSLGSEPKKAGHLKKKITHISRSREKNISWLMKGLTNIRVCIKSLNLALSQKSNAPPFVRQQKFLFSKSTCGKEQYLPKKVGKSSLSIPKQNCSVCSICTNCDICEKKTENFTVKSILMATSVREVFSTAW